MVRGALFWQERAPWTLAGSKETISWGIPMEAWWEGLTALNKVFAISALAFSVAFLVQMIMMLIGLDVHGHDIGGTDIHAPDMHDIHHVPGVDDGAHGATLTFLSVRSIMAFGTLFTWAGTLYLATGTPLILAIVYSFLWGLAGLFAVSFLLYWLLHMQEEGNVPLWKAVGEEGTVYMDIPERGIGKVRILYGRTVCFVNARSRSGEPLLAGTAVKAVGTLDERTLEVDLLTKNEED